MASNRKPLMLESMLLDVASSDELETFNRLMDSRRKGAAVCYAMRIVRFHWARLINSQNAVNMQNKSARQVPEDEFFIKRIVV